MNFGVSTFSFLLPHNHDPLFNGDQFLLCFCLSSHVLSLIITWLSSSLSSSSSPSSSFSWIDYWTLCVKSHSPKSTPFHALSSFFPLTLFQILLLLFDFSPHFPHLHQNLLSTSFSLQPISLTHSIFFIISFIFLFSFSFSLCKLSIMGCFQSKTIHLPSPDDDPPPPQPKPDPGMFLSLWAYESSFSVFFHVLICGSVLVFWVVGFVFFRGVVKLMVKNLKKGKFLHSRSLS